MLKYGTAAKGLTLRWKIKQDRKESCTVSRLFITSICTVSIAIQKTSGATKYFFKGSRILFFQSSIHKHKAFCATLSAPSVYPYPHLYYSMCGLDTTKKDQQITQSSWRQIKEEAVWCSQEELQKEAVMAGFGRTTVQSRWFLLYWTFKSYYFDSHHNNSH